MMGIEPMTSSLPRKCSTPELHWHLRAGNETRTRDPQLGRLMLYQLSYSRNLSVGGGRRIRTSEVVRQQIYSLPQLATLVSPPRNLGADERTRTADRLITNQLLYQLSYIGQNIN